ncbi:PAS domain-containing hybrid sensor histidine kinase/response regulator [Butyricimonas virosa]|jgi:signal transduction histidine kinase/CheY-like chemotaxis protein|uniref:hybrid sensor histidine kinase/response regulator n=1 Tax=Butyricimonas virosa TaxID=544645 RepID=UPI0022E5F150|nr:PAS domain-containing hybrid sensor histidine kinase/response regulator [Butyricimonas virosa]MCI6415220.1 ATP-binding protein [Butyricimonas virosa]
MGVYESLTREELVRKLLTQENLCLELQGKVGKLQEEIFQQAKNGESGGKNEGDLCENVVVKRTEKFLTDNVVRLSLMLEAGNVFPWFADIVSGKIEIGDELFKAYGVDRKEFHDDFFRMTTFVASIYPDDRGIFEAIYNSLLAGESCKIDLELRLDLLNTGVYKWVDLKGVAQEFDERGKVTKVLGFIADIQKRRDDEQALIEAKQRAEESDCLKSAFLANVSHEIRTPLNAIVGFSEVIAHTESECEREEYLDIVKANSNLLLHLINDILDLSRIESGKMEFIDENIQMDELCEELRQMHQMRIKNDVKIIFERPAASLTIVSDSHRLRQLYSNLISNAIKYTEKGAITFGYKLKGDMMEGYVRDSGSGIPAEKLNNVFGRFEKLDLLKQGFGLGLSICKSILDKMGGEIWVESELGVGSCFYFLIPCNGTFPVAGEQNKPLILVAEDMDCNYELVKAILEERYSVLRANDGIDVVTKYESSKPDLILMDVRMPGLDGLSAAGIIRELNPTVPIIATTAFAFETDREMALAAGCNEYMSKPLEAEKLKTMVERYLENKL